MFVKRTQTYQTAEKNDPREANLLEKKREACFYLLSPARAMKEVQGGGAGSILMDRDGEDVITECWSNTLQRMREKPAAYYEARRVIEDMDVTLTFASSLKTSSRAMT